MRAPTQLSEATTCSQELWVKRQDFVKLDEGRGDLGVGSSGVEIWVWGPVGWRFGCGDQWGGDLGVGTSEWWMFVLRD